MSSNNISRRNFLRDFSILTASSATGIKKAIGNSGDAVLKDNGLISYFENRDNQSDCFNTRRGSWVRETKPEPGDVALVSLGEACQIVINQKEHSAVKQAVEFLASDIEKISGLKPAVQSNHLDHLSRIIVATVGETDIPSTIDVTGIKGKWEAFKIETAENSVWLIGSDFRGTAFAIYTLCERLGVDPLYIWSGFVPMKRKNLILKHTSYIADSPTFKYRGFFHDDEDVLPRPFDYNGYPLQTGDINMVWYRRFFETALRLKMNMVAPYTRVHRRYEVQKCASEWGLFFTSHHYDILLSNPYGLRVFDLAKKRDVKPHWNWNENREGMIKYWSTGVWENKDIDCIWPVGLRGTEDLPYSFPKGTTEREEARMFHDVIEAQVNAAKKIMRCDEPPVFTLTLYNEMLEKYENQKDIFDIPEDVIIIWPDDYLGAMRKLPKTLEKWKHGVYYHLAVAGFDLTMQSANMVPPRRITEEFQKIIDSGATEYLLVNVSQLREYTMGARLIADICFDAPSILEKKDPGGSYINWWCNEYFGTGENGVASQIYAHYYKLLYWPNRLWVGSDMVWKMLENLVKKVSGEPYELLDKEEIDLLENRQVEFETAMKIYSKAAASMDYLQHRYYFETTVMGLYFDWRPTQSAFLLLKALKEKNSQKMWNYILESIKPLEQLELEILRAERPPFEKWYRPTWLRPKLTGRDVHRSYEAVRTFISTRGRKYIPFDDINESHVPVNYQSWNLFLEESAKIGTPLS